MKIGRIDKLKNGFVDDVVVSDVKMFRLEMMDDNAYWMAFHFKKRKRIDFDLWVEKGKLRIRQRLTP